MGIEISRGGAGGIEILEGGGPKKPKVARCRLAHHIDLKISWHP